MRIGRFLLTAVITASAVTAMATPQADKGKMDQFIDNLMGKMTLQEKIGQLNLPVSGEIVLSLLWLHRKPIKVKWISLLTT